MRKGLFFIILGVLAVLADQVLARTISVNWDYTGASESFNIYDSSQAYTSQNVYQVSNVPIPDARTSDVNIIEDGIHFISMTAVTNGAESPRSNTYVLKTQGGNMIQSAPSINSFGSNVDITWEDLPGITEYQVRITDSTDYETVNTVYDNTLSIILPYDTYNIQIVPIGIDGNKILAPNDDVIYPGQNLYQGTCYVVSPPPPPAPPQIKLESVGLNDQTLITAINQAALDPRTDQLRIYISGTAAKALAKEGEIWQGSVSVTSVVCNYINLVNNLPAYLKVAPYNKTQLEMIFVAVTTYDADTDTESTPTIAYKLFGDITNTQQEGYLYNQLTVNGVDFSTFRNYYYKPVTHRVTGNYCASTNLWNVFPLTTAERSDYDKNGTVNGVDFSFFNKNYYHTAAGY